MIFLSHRLSIRSPSIFAGCIFVGTCITIICIFYLYFYSQNSKQFLPVDALIDFTSCVCGADNISAAVVFVEHSIESIQHKFFAYKNYFLGRRFPFNSGILLIFYLAGIAATICIGKLKKR